MTAWRVTRGTDLDDMRETCTSLPYPYPCHHHHHHRPLFRVFINRVLLTFSAPPRCPCLPICLFCVLYLCHDHNQGLTVWFVYVCLSVCISFFVLCVCVAYSGPWTSTLNNHAMWPRMPSKPPTSRKAKSSSRGNLRARARANAIKNVQIPKSIFDTFCFFFNSVGRETLTRFPLCLFLDVCIVRWVARTSIYKHWTRSWRHKSVARRWSILTWTS